MEVTIIEKLKQVKSDLENNKANLVLTDLALIETLAGDIGNIASVQFTNTREMMVNKHKV